MKPINKEECCDKCTTWTLPRTCINSACSCHTKPTELSELMTDFNKEFPRLERAITLNSEEIILIPIGKIKSFITKTYTTALAKGRAEERNRIRKLVEGKKFNNEDIKDIGLSWQAHPAVGYNKALSDISSGLGGGE